MSRRSMRTLLIAAAILLCFHSVLSASLYWAMCQPPDVFGRIMAHTPMPFMLVLPFETLWKHARLGRLKPGDPAPDFRLPTLDHRETVQLSSFRGARPVVLVFGSYT
ncbi:MAG TPA: hypothetical protein VLY04_13980 [Bryobacteraceae bacterium]|nr:hypothetical protein [Bryobacteraceae bacterium]